MNKPAQFTPGPWTIERDRAKSLSLYSGTTFIGEVWHESDEPTPQQNANVALIAAAPAMYEALKASLLAIPDGMTSNTSPICQQIRAALAQAEGRQA